MVKKLAGLMIRSNRKLLKILRQEIVSYQRYESGELKVIGLPGYKNTDCIVKEKMSYSVWLTDRHKYTTVKVEGLESILSKFFKKIKAQDIHLFVNQKNAYSFKWHYDDVNVFLYVLKGQKKLQVKNKTYWLTAGQGAYIPKRHLHRAFSCNNTWALSIGF
jgi:mannose-6-phosphate isomerase-like protein (cupin superfamily)